MLTSQFGIRLVLWLGKDVPAPASPEVLQALTSAEVTLETDGSDGFQMTFTLGRDHGLDYRLLAGGTLDPDTRVVLGAVLGVLPEPLIDGVICHHQVTPGQTPGTSTLTVSGRDLSVLFDLEERNDKYENQPDSVIATRVIGRYARYGIVPLATPTTEVPLAVQRIPRQQESDLKFLRRLARRNGFVFHLEPLTLGTSRAYWGPEDRRSLPQPALSYNLGAASNVTSLSSNYDALAPVGARGSFVEPITKQSIPIPPLPSLRIPPLAGLPSVPRRFTLLRTAAHLGPVQAAAALLAATDRAPYPVRLSGDLDTARYGHILRARRPVGVRGAGRTYDGDYLVKRVTHRIERGKYTQSFELEREGTGALSPWVRT